MGKIIEEAELQNEILNSAWIEGALSSEWYTKWVNESYAPIYQYWDRAELIKERKELTKNQLTMCGDTSPLTAKINAIKNLLDSGHK